MILSYGASNKHLNRVQVVPLTSNVSRLNPSEAYVVLQGEQRKVLADQLTTVSKARLSECLGRLSEEDLRARGARDPYPVELVGLGAWGGGEVVIRHHPKRGTKES